MGNRSLERKRMAKDRMGRARAYAYKDKHKTFHEATRLAKDRKAFRNWLMDPTPERATRD
jgi:hypothetical protein